MRFRKTAIIFAASMMLMTACGLSEENQNLITQSQTSMLEAKEAAEAVYGELTQETYKDTIYDLSEKAGAYEEIDLKELKEDDVLGFVGEMNQITSSYENLTAEMTTALEEEKREAEEAAKYKEILCYIENKSGSELSSIVINDNSTNETSDNLLADGQTLPSGSILAGVSITVNEESTARMVITTDTLGNENNYGLDIGDIAEIVENGMSLTILSVENGVKVGPYTTDPEENKETGESLETQDMDVSGEDSNESGRSSVDTYTNSDVEESDNTSSSVDDSDDDTDSSDDTVSGTDVDSSNDTDSESAGSDDTDSDTSSASDDD